MIEPRKVCITCNKPLIAFNKHYLHIEMPCAGLLDYIDIEAVISDEFLHEKFEKLYGVPSINDYERIAILEEKIKELIKIADDLIKLAEGKEEIILQQNIKLNFPLIKFMLNLFHK